MFRQTVAAVALLAALAAPAHADDGAGATAGDDQTQQSSNQGGEGARARAPHTWKNGDEHPFHVQLQIGTSVSRWLDGDGSAALQICGLYGPLGLFVRGDATTADGWGASRVGMGIEYSLFATTLVHPILGVEVGTTGDDNRYVEPSLTVIMNVTDCFRVGLRGSYEIVTTGQTKSGRGLLALVFRFLP